MSRGRYKQPAREPSRPTVSGPGSWSVEPTPTSLRREQAEREDLRLKRQARARVEHGSGWAEAPREGRRSVPPPPGRTPAPLSPDDLARIEDEAQRLHDIGLIRTPEEQARNRARHPTRNQVEQPRPRTPAWVQPEHVGDVENVGRKQGRRHRRPRG